MITGGCYFQAVLGDCFFTKFFFDTGTGCVGGRDKESKGEQGNERKQELFHESLFL